jgi:hypothetical protein
MSLLLYKPKLLGLNINFLVDDSLEIKFRPGASQWFLAISDILVATFFVHTDRQIYLGYFPNKQSGISHLNCTIYAYHSQTNTKVRRTPHEPALIILDGSTIEIITSLDLTVYKSQQEFLLSKRHPVVRPTKNVVNRLINRIKELV